MFNFEWGLAGCLPYQDSQGIVRELHYLTQRSRNCQGNWSFFVKSGKCQGILPFSQTPCFKENLLTIFILARRTHSWLWRFSTDPPIFSWQLKIVGLHFLKSVPKILNFLDNSAWMESIPISAWSHPQIYGSTNASRHAKLDNLLIMSFIAMVFDVTISRSTTYLAYAMRASQIVHY